MLGRTDSDPEVGSAELPPIPGKRYFTIGEVSELCGVKPHVLRYWEQEFPQLKPAKRRGNRRYYQRHDVLMVRQIRSLFSALRLELESVHRVRIGPVATVEELETIRAKLAEAEIEATPVTATIEQPPP